MTDAGGAQIGPPGPAGDAGAAAFTLGLEEEFQLIDSATRNLRASAAGVLAAAQPAQDEAVLVAGLTRALARNATVDCWPPRRPEPLSLGSV